MGSEPVYNTYIEDVNRGKFRAFNVFKHYSFVKDVQETIKKYTNKEEFAEQLRHDAMYYFWAKCEYEIIISEWPPSPSKHTEEKVDVYDQLMLNWPVFVDYVWNHRNEIEALNYE